MVVYGLLKNYFIEKIMSFTNVIVSITERTTFIIGLQHGFTSLLEITSKNIIYFIITDNIYLLKDLSKILDKSWNAMTRVLSINITSIFE